jgi:hypothetical protein
MADSYELLKQLLKKAEAGELPKKKADMLKYLQGKVDSGLSITEVQAELLEDLGTEYGLC